MRLKRVLLKRILLQIGLCFRQPLFVFAPVGANLSRGFPVESVGPRILDFVKEPLPGPRAQGDTILGAVLHVDKFGNIITNLRRHHLGSSDFTIRVAGVPITRFCATFSEADPGEFFAVEGGAGYIELALNQGSAADRLKVERGAEIEVEVAPVNH